MMVVFTIANTALGMKSQLVKPMVDRFRADLEAFRHHAATPKGHGALKATFSFEADLQEFFAPSFPVDTLKMLVFDRISALGKALSLVVQIENASLGLYRSVEERRSLISSFKLRPMDDAWALRYFGEKLPSGHTHREFADLVDVIASFTDDVIYFSGSLIEELLAHGQVLHNAFSRAYGEGAPKVSSPDFSGPKKSGLYPSAADYEAWERWITERGDPKEGMMKAHGQNVLNGWRRLGIILSAVWLAFVATVFSEPSAAPAMSAWMRPCDRLSDPLCLFDTASPLRVSFLASLPIIALWGLGYAAGWIRKGFSDNH
ncbi:MAG TPA: hypothetical protein VHA82_17950 [Ramlibacter sp.]|uniref:hypothetical protein n=1 Tax=Ramlibacter sp. TaxID=1917967 RepID=UPI002C3BCEAF|nr:hypothetical protein [Ramlibacter sp.]HVZ45696.1 hypothetical protein [Ramlibacter sp.]